MEKKATLPRSSQLTARSIVGKVHEASDRFEVVSLHRHIDACEALFSKDQITKAPPHPSYTDPARFCTDEVRRMSGSAPMRHGFDRSLTGSTRAASPSPLPSP